MVVEVDDAGWGDLLGGAVIVVRRVGSGESYAGEVPLEAFRGAAFAEKRYLPPVMEAVRRGLSRLGVTRDEPIRVCTGYILSHVREALRNEGFNVKPARITGETQLFAEEEFVKSLSRLGVGSPEEVHGMRSFTGFLNWVRGDLEERERFVKTGWGSWSRHRRGARAGS